MIFYFSATGNSLWAARQFGRHFDMTPVSVADAMKKGECRFDVSASPFVMFVFPVHSWGPAVAYAQSSSAGWSLKARRQEIYAVCTCGDDCGRTDRMTAGALADRGWKLTRIFSLIMPNSYILLPLFDIDSPQLAERKLENAPFRRQRHNRSHRDRKSPRADSTRKSSAAWFKTKVINFGFRRYMQDGRGLPCDRRLQRLRTLHEICRKAISGSAKTAVRCGAGSASSASPAYTAAPAAR